MNRFMTASRTPARQRLCAAALLIAFGAAGCRTTAIYVPDGQPVRLAETVKGASVWVCDKDGRWVRSTMDIPEGWYALADPGAGE